MSLQKISIKASMIREITEDYPQSAVDMVNELQVFLERLNRDLDRIANLADHIKSELPEEYQ